MKLTFFVEGFDPYERSKGDHELEVLGVLDKFDFVKLTLLETNHPNKNHIIDLSLDIHETNSLIKYLQSCLENSKIVK